MVKLKDGSDVQDARLDRLEEFDERSRNFPIRTMVESKPLRSYTWRCNEFFNQQKQGSCVAYAIGHELAARPVEVKGITDKWLVEKIYWEAQRNDPWEGGVYPGATPKYEGTSLLAGVKAAHQKKFFESYRWAFSLEDVLLGVGYNGPAVIGVPWYSGMYNTDYDGYVSPTGKPIGGHAVLVRSVNVKKKHVIIRNSWGKSWGINGDCYMTFDDLGTLLDQRGEAVFMQKRTATLHEANFI